MFDIVYKRHGSCRFRKGKQSLCPHCGSKYKKQLFWGRQSLLRQHVVCVLGMRMGGKCEGRGGEWVRGLHKPELLAFPVVPWGPKNTSHILLTPAALWHSPTNKRNAVRHLSPYRSPVSGNPALSKMKADAARNQMCAVGTAAAES